MILLASQPNLYFSFSPSAFLVMEYSDSFAPLDATWKNILMNGNLAEDG